MTPRRALGDWIQDRLVPALNRLGCWLACGHDRLYAPTREDAIRRDGTLICSCGKVVRRALPLALIVVAVGGCSR